MRMPVHSDPLRRDLDGCGQGALTASVAGVAPLHVKFFLLDSNVWTYTWALYLMFVPLFLVYILTEYFHLSALFVWFLTKGDSCYSRLQKIHSAVSESLRKSAESYDPASYNPLHLLELLIPARKIVEYKVSVYQIKSYTFGSLTV